MRAALGFLTPLGGARAPNPGALPWFPAIGAVVGFGVGGVWWGAFELWESMAVAAALAVVADLALTGMLHLDGLADSADGLLPHLATRARRLSVMRTPDVGAFGIAVVGVALLLRFAALSSGTPEPWPIAGVWAVSRSVAGLTLVVGTYARDGGLASAFGEGSPVVAWAAFGVTAVVSTAVAGGAAIACAVGALAVVVLARRRIGGYTGDVLGAAIVVGETAGLLVVALP